MIKNTLKKLVLLALVPFLFTNCASALNGKFQKVIVNTPSADTEVFVNDVSYGKGTAVTVKMQRDRGVKQVKLEREGYKPQYRIHFQDRKSPLYIMSWIPFAVLIVPPLYDVGPRAYNFPREVQIDEQMLEIIKRTENQKYVYLKNTTLDMEKEDIKYIKTRYKDLKKKNNKFKSLGTADGGAKFNNAALTEEVNNILKKSNYIDTTNTIYQSNTNTLWISAKVVKGEFNNITTNAVANLGYSSPILKVKLEIEWEIFDLYNQSKFKKTLISESGEFSKDFYDRKSHDKCTNDAIAQSFFTFMNTNEVKALIEQQETKELKLDILTLARPASVTSLEQAMEATVTIKTKDGHGSGCFVTNDGYIVTNFHVVANSDKLTVITKDNKEHQASLVRKNEYSDLALLKIDTNNQYAFTLPNSKNYNVGDDIFAIGTPRTIELGQSLSKGIISGFRSNDKMTMIQTDASVNGGNSGGALVSKSGEFIGVVNAKLFGIGIEGLGFSIPAETVLTDLSIKY